MHILLTDLLTCPRCGPEFGLLVLADVLDDRVVVEGRLGCANCRGSYSVEAGVADLRHALVPPLPAGEFGNDPDRIFRAAALLGVTGANAAVLVVESTGAAAAGVAEILGEPHVVGASADAPDVRQAPTGMLSQIVTGERIPLRGRSVQGVAILGGHSPELIAEAARVLVPGARLVVDPAPDDLATRLLDHGYTVQLEQEGVVVAAAPGPR